ncbi:MAG TPA: hypothetical protein PKN32_09800 [Bacteroidales bacterium]|nr:hypothetical protein [Bacteroidales bacterium]
MKYTFVFLLYIFFFAMIHTSFAQNDQYSVQKAEELGILVKYVSTGNNIYDNKVWKRDLIVYFRENYSFPSFTYTGNKDIDIALFNKSVTDWYAEYPEFNEVLDIPPVFQDFQDYDMSCYHPAPVYIKDGNAEQERVYEKRFSMWMAGHPYGPIPASEKEESKMQHEKEKDEFYEKYYKK